MRTFGAKVRPELEQQVRQAAEELFAAVPERREHLGSEFAMDDETAVVMYEVTIPVSEDERYRINASLPSSRPPFEWQMEITADMGESDYIKHYLIRDDDIVLAQRKVLTVIDDAEAELMLADMAVARAALDS